MRAHARSLATDIEMRDDLPAALSGSTSLHTARVASPGPRLRPSSRRSSQRRTHGLTDLDALRAVMCPPPRRSAAPRAARRPTRTPTSSRHGRPASRSEPRCAGPGRQRCWAGREGLVSSSGLPDTHRAAPPAQGVDLDAQLAPTRRQATLNEMGIAARISCHLSVQQSHGASKSAVPPPLDLGV